MKRLTIFCHHDKDNIVDDYIIYWLKYMCKLSDIIFVSNSNLLSSELTKLSVLCIKIISIKHNGFGTESFKIGYKYAYDNNILKNYDWLIIIADSIY